VEITKFVVEILVAIGTLLAVVTALWKEKLCSWLRIGPHLSLEPYNNFRGSLMDIQGKKVAFYHLRVVNRRDVYKAENCRVMLRKIWRLQGERFCEVHLTAPLIFAWPPSELTPLTTTVLRDAVVDLGNIWQEHNCFCPGLRAFYRNFEGIVRENQTVRFGLEIVCDNFVSPRLQVFEVAYNGIWSDDAEVMAQNLRVRESEEPQPFDPVSG
jgi:hypothetical protein